MKNLAFSKLWEDQENRWEQIKKQDRTIYDEPGVQYVIKFKDSRYSVSIVKNYGSYGYEKDLWEIGLLHGDTFSNRIMNDFELPDGVIGWLTDEDVLEWIEKFYKAYVLEPKKTEIEGLRNYIRKQEEKLQDLKEELKKMEEEA